MTARHLKTAIGLAAACTLFGAAADVRAQSFGDYNTLNQRWNGLSKFRELGEGMSLKVLPLSSVNWDDIGEDDTLFLLYPTSRVDAGQVVTFIRGGGNVVLADDFGGSREIMGRLGISRDEDAVVGGSFWREFSFAPIARPVAPEHPLAADVTELVGNHPAVLPEVEGPDTVFAFGAGEAAVVAGRLGAGRFVVMSDPSMLINRMLEFDGNLQFAVNLLRYLTAPSGDGRIIIMTGRVSFRGEPRAVDGAGGSAGGVAGLLHQLNDFLDELNDYLLTAGAARVLGILFGIAIGVIALLSLPWRRALALDGDWVAARGGEQAALGPHEIVARYETNPARENYLLPAALLRDALNARLERALDIGDPLSSQRRSEVVAAVEARHGAAAAGALRAIADRLCSLPGRSQAGAPWAAESVSRDEFERLKRGVESVCRTLKGDR